MVKLKNIASWFLGISCLLIMMSFGYNKALKTRVLAPAIQVDNGAGVYFVTQQEIQKMLLEAYPFYDSLRLNEINITLLEETLDNHPSIRKSEVYSDFNGRLNINVKQKKPIARILAAGNSYYLTAQGDSMPLSKNYSAEVPLLTGNVTRKTRAAAYSFLQQTSSDDFYNKFFTGLHIHANHTWDLYPQVGRFKILFGEQKDVENKLKKLKTFYQTMVDESTLNQIKSIDLRFKNQVICQKYPNE